MSNVSIEDLRKEIIQISKVGDWSLITAKQVREQLEEKFGVSLIDRRAEIDQLLMEYVNSQEKVEENSDEEEDDLNNFEEDDLNDFEEEDLDFEDGDFENDGEQDDEEENYDIEEEDNYDFGEQEDYNFGEEEEEDHDTEDEDYGFEEEEEDDFSDNETEDYDIENDLIHSLWNQMMLNQDHNHTNQVGANKNFHVVQMTATGEMVTVSAEDLYKAIIPILEQNDWSTLTNKKVREQLEEDFGIDLTPCKKEISNFVMQYIHNKEPDKAV